MAIQLLFKLSFEADDGQACGELSKQSHGLIELLSEYLFDENQSEPVKNGIVAIFTSISAEENENLKEAIIVRGHILDYLMGLRDPCESTCIDISCLLINLYCQNVTQLLDSDHIFDTCLELLGKTLNRVQSQTQLYYAIRCIRVFLRLEEPLKHNKLNIIDAIFDQSSVG